MTGPSSIDDVRVQSSAMVTTVRFDAASHVRCHTHTHMFTVAPIPADPSTSLPRGGGNGMWIVIFPLASAVNRPHAAAHGPSVSARTRGSVPGPRTP